MTCTKICQVEGKFIFVQILIDGTVHQEVRRARKEFQAAERGGARFFFENKSIEQHLCNMWLI